MKLLQGLSCQTGALTSVFLPVFSPAQPIKWQVTSPDTRHPSQLFIPGFPLRMANSFPAAPVIAQIAAPSLWTEWPSDESTCPVQSLQPDVPLGTEFQPPFHFFEPVLIICWWKDTIIWLILFLTTVIDFSSISSCILSTHLGFPALCIASKKMPYQICSSSLSNSAKAHKPRRDNIDPHGSQEGI